jgi:hypothetical protein
MTFDASTLGVKVTLSEPAGSQVQGEAFSINKKFVYLLLGTLPVSRPSLERVLAGQLGDAGEVTNLSIRARSKFVDLLVTVLTAGLVVPRTVTFEGVVVQR